MATVMDSTATTQVYRVYIQATPEAIWDAITKPDWNERYGYRCRQEFDLQPGGAYRGYANEEMKQTGTGEVIVDGEVIEVDPPNKLGQTWRASWAGGGFSRLTSQIKAGLGGGGALRHD